MTRLAAYLTLLFAATLALYAIDATLAAEDASEQPAAVAARPTSRWHGGSQRAFVLLVDSLRHADATDAALMPNLARLRAAGLSARVATTPDAVTVPAIRAAFSGRSQVRLFGFVENFIRGDVGLPSLFSQLDAEKRCSVAYSDGAFAQFGRRTPREKPNETVGMAEVAGQNDAVRLAFGEHAAGRCDLTVVHITYVDHTAHSYGVDHPRHRAVHAVVDDMIGKLAAAISPDDTFVVFGDHGHDLSGRHAMGLDVPTFALYRGPGFCAGCNPGTLPIAEHRFLLGWALETPLPADYGGGAHPDLLRATGPRPAGYDGPARAPRVTAGHAAPRQAARLAVLALLLAVVAVRFKRLWIDVPPLPRRRQPWLWAAGGALGLVSWGVLLAAVRPWLHEPSFPDLAVGWALLATVLLAVVWRVRSPRPAWLALGAVLLIGFPTVYRYGAPGSLVPAWLAALGVAVAAQRRVSGAAAGELALAALLLAPFLGVDAADFAFDRWLGLPQLLGGAYLAPALLGLIAKGVLLIRRRDSRRVQGLGLALLAFLTWLEAAVARPTPELAVAAVALGLAAWLRWRRKGTDEESAPARLLVIAGGLTLVHATVHVPPDRALWLDAFLAAAVLSARVLRRTTPPALLAGGRALLLLLGLTAAGWTSLTWTVQPLEWNFLYTWFPARAVESAVWLFLPAILARYAIALWLWRRLVDAELGPPDRASRALGIAVMGLKVAALVLLTAGLGLWLPTSDVYLEAAAEAVIAVVVAAGAL